VRVSFDLLGRHVLQRADELADIRLERRDREIRIGGPSHAEVDDLRLAVGVHEDVAGLEVAVDDPLLVTVVDRVAHLGKQLQALAGAQRPGLREFGDRPRVGDVLHGEVRHGTGALVVRAGFVHLGDVGMPQAGQDL
jgi:hypothetical protein